MKTFSSPEPLEARIAPAAFTASTFTYTDFDGDHVTVKLSRPVLNAGNVDSVFNFSGGGSIGEDPQDLYSIDLSALGVNGLSISVTVAPGVRGSGGGGTTTVGSINAGLHDLGDVVVQGDLGRITAGDNNPDTPALRHLSVQSMGLYGLSTQGPDDTASLQSTFRGPVGSIFVRSDVRGAAFTGSSLGSLHIGGSLIGEPLDSSDDTIQGTALVYFRDSIGPVTIGKNLIGADFDALNTGIYTQGPIASLSIGGSIIASEETGQENAFIAGAQIGPVHIGGNVRGGVAQYSGSLTATTSLASLYVGGSVLGSDGEFSGRILGGVTGPVRIMHDVIGGLAQNSGNLAFRSATSLMVGGSVQGSDGENSGAIFLDTRSGPVFIGGDLQGGDGGHSGFLFAGNSIPRITIGGSIIGGNGDSSEDDTIVDSGEVRVAGSVGWLAIGRDVHGGLAVDSGKIVVQGPIHLLTIGGSVIGGTADVDAGESESGGQIRSGTSLDRVIVHGDVVGGPGQSAGQLYSDGTIGSVLIYGSVSGAEGFRSGGISANGHIGKVVILGSLHGAGGDNSGSIFSFGAIDQVLIGGDMTSFSGGNSGRIYSETTLGMVHVHGDVTNSAIGARGVFNPANNEQALAIREVGIAGSASSISIVAGAEVDGGEVNPDVIIGSVSVGGDFRQSLVEAGVDVASLDKFGDGGSGLIVSRVARITIGGAVIGLEDNRDSRTYGVAADYVQAARLGPAGRLVPLLRGAHNDAYPLGLTADSGLYETDPPEEF